VQAPWGRVLRCRPLAEVARHFFTDRSLELRDTKDEWREVARLAGVDNDRLLLVRQVHGRTTAVADVSRSDPWVRPEADAVISNDPSSALAIRVADCAPILLADRRQPVVAAVHAGWRSTMQRIVERAVDEMKRQFNTNPEDLVAAIGPSLGSCCGEMGEEVVEAFRHAGHSETEISRWFERVAGRGPHFDLWRANREQLEASGIPSAQIHTAELCTKTWASTFHSYRAAGQQAGRMVAVIRAVSS
jgi:polyphenol oxidase